MPIRPDRGGTVILQSLRGRSWSLARCFAAPFLGVVFSALPYPISTEGSVPPRLVVVISDLHFGVGRVDGSWHPIEDFRWADEFEQFLEHIHTRGNGATDLILNGDTFELWQSLAQLGPHPDCKYADPNLGCTASEAAARLDLVINSHRRELLAIRKFADRDQNHVALVPGNHDAALLWPQLAAQVLNEIGAGPGRVEITSSGYWISPDGQVLVEHGHQIGEDPNRFCRTSSGCTWPLPFVTSGSKTHLHRPWGEVFVQDFYNQYETTYPIVDNLSSESLGIEYGVAASGFSGSLEGAFRFLRFFLTQQSWAQFSQVLGDRNSRSPEWDLAAIRQQDPSAFILDSLPADSDLRRELSDKQHPSIDPPLTDTEVRAICDKRELTNLVNAGRGHPAVPSCPRLPETLRGLNQYLLRSKSEIFTTHLIAMRDNVVRSNFRIFVYSHTHQAEQAFSPLTDASHYLMVETAPGKLERWLPLVINAGAWQRVINEDQVNSLRRERWVIGPDARRVPVQRTAELTKKQLLSLSPEDLPACYSAVLIDLADAPLDPILRWWHLDADGRWVLSAESDAPECPRSKGPGIAPPPIQDRP